MCSGQNISFFKENGFYCGTEFGLWSCAMKVELSNMQLKMVMHDAVTVCCI